MSKLMPEEKEILIDTVNATFNILNRAINNKDMLVANASLVAINKTINFMNETEQEENKN